MASNQLCGLGTPQGSSADNGTYTAEGITKLCEALKRSAVTSLNLARNQLGPKGAVALADGLKNNSTLQELDLTFNMLCGTIFGSNFNQPRGHWTWTPTV